MADLERGGIGGDEASRVHRRAAAHYPATVETYLRFNASASGPSLAALPPVGEAIARAQTLQSIPTYAYLFGSQDYGLCEDWESVTGQVAYFVDLLVWLSKAPRTTGALHPYDVLVARRPDLVTLLLGRANAKTLVPHIDLVCELLEDAVALRCGLSRIAPPDLHTKLSAEEIRAYPEHVHSGVYDVLRTRADAVSLPFDLPLEEVRGYLPSVLRIVPELPLTANGKVDARMLLANESPARARGNQDQQPRNQTEDTIARLWAELFELDDVGLDDDFFQLGGHSLLACACSAS